jgi:hypothetical protein
MDVITEGRERNRNGTKRMNKMGERGQGIGESGIK